MTVNASNTLFYKIEFGLCIICFPFATPDSIIRSLANVPLETEYPGHDLCLVFPLSNELFPFGLHASDWSAELTLSSPMRSLKCGLKSTAAFQTGRFSMATVPAHHCIFIPWLLLRRFVPGRSVRTRTAGTRTSCFPRGWEQPGTITHTTGFSSCFQITSFPEAHNPSYAIRSRLEDSPRRQQAASRLQTEHPPLC